MEWIYSYNPWACTGAKARSLFTLDALPDAEPAASKHWRQVQEKTDRWGENETETCVVILTWSAERQCSRLARHGEDVSGETARRSDMLSVNRWSTRSRRDTTSTPGTAVLPWGVVVVVVRSVEVGPAGSEVDNNANSDIDNRQHLSWLTAVSDSTGKYSNTYNDIINHQSSIINQSSITNQSSIINLQSPIINHQSSIINHQSIIVTFRRHYCFLIVCLYMWLINLLIFLYVLYFFDF